MLIELLNKEDAKFLGKVGEEINNILLDYLNKKFNTQFKVNIKQLENDADEFAAYYNLDKDSFITAEIRLSSDIINYDFVTLFPSNNPSSKTYTVSNGCTHEVFKVSIINRNESIDELKRILNLIIKDIDKRISNERETKYFSYGEICQTVLDTRIKSYTFLLS